MKAKQKVFRVKITFIDDILGTASGDPDLHETHIASKAPDAQSTEEEVAAIGVDGVVEKGKTLFPRNKDGEPIFWNYQIKGFFKGACSGLRAIEGTLSNKLKAYKKMIDLRVFVFADASDRANRMITIHTDEPIGSCQRPLRASTPQGERIALADSEVIKAGAWCEFDILLLDANDEDIVMEWLDYGSLNGIGQWRNSGKGAFVWEKIEDDAKAAA